MKRELAIALRARVTWIVAALSALLIAHGFVLSVDVFSAASRTAALSAFQAREMDPLAGIVRPTLGGLDLAISLLAPIVAARVLAIEKERGSLGALCLQVGSTARVLLRKWFAAMVAAGLLFAPVLVCLLLYRAIGGHLDAIESAIALLGELLHLALIVSVSMAAASFATGLAAATTAAIAISLGSWAIDAADGIAALAWLGGAERWSIARRIAPMHHGLVAVGSVLWLLVAIALSIGLALIGMCFHWPLRRRLKFAAPLFAAGLVALALSTRVRVAYDWTAQRRASLPPAVVASLRSFREPIALEVMLDRDDSRRRQLESDVVVKLLLARPDAVVRFPLDERDAVATGVHDASYGRIWIHVGGSSRETRSTSRRELTTLVLEAAGRPMPDWTMPPYSGYPFVAEGTRRRIVGIAAYVVMPLLLLSLGLALSVLSRKRSAR